MITLDDDDLTAAGWNPEDHPRGADGRFIEAGAVVDLLKKATKDLTANDVDKAVRSLDPKLWQKLKPEQREHIADSANKLSVTHETRKKLAQLGVPTGQKPTEQKLAVPAATKTKPREDNDVFDAVPNGYLFSFKDGRWNVRNGDDSPSVISAVEDYTELGYVDLNRSLRENSGDISALNGHNQQLVHGLTKALTGSELTDDIITHRGIKDGSKVFGDAWNGDLTGARWTEHGFLSTTVNAKKGYAFGSLGGERGAVMRIRVPKGVRALALAEDKDDAEGEVLLDRGLKLQVTKDHGILGGIRHLDVEVVRDRDREEAEAHREGAPEVGRGEADNGLSRRAGEEAGGGGEERKPVVPAVIYKKNADGTVVAESPDGKKRMRWDAGQSKYVVEDENGKQLNALTKTDAYKQVKNPKRWVAPVGLGKTGALKPSPETPQSPRSKTEAPSGGGVPVVPAIIYKKNADGTVVAESPDGSRRMRWDEASKKFVVEDRDGKQLDTLTKTAAYKVVKDPKKWVQPQGDMTPEVTPEPTPAPTPNAKSGPRDEDLTVFGNVARSSDGTWYTRQNNEWVKASPMMQGVMEEFHRKQQEKTGQIGTEVESPAPPQTPEPETSVVETAVKPEAPTYVGPKIDFTPHISQDLLDRIHKISVDTVIYHAKVDDLAEKLRRENPEKYDGFNGFRLSQDDARAQVGPEPDFSEVDRILDEAIPGYGDRYILKRRIKERLYAEAKVDGALYRFAQRNGLEMSDQLKEDLARRTREAFTGKKIAVRVTPKILEKILADGRFKSQFESGTSKGKKDFDMRAAVERLLFGITDQPHQNPEKRPIYGYVAMDGIRPAGAGSREVGGVVTDALSQYGNVQVILKDSVRSRTTAMFGDSLNNRHEGLPSPVDDPAWYSFTPSRGGITGEGLEGLERSADVHGFRAGSYAEAQIHGGVSVDDIEEVILPSASAALQKALDAKGIRWRVLNWGNVHKVDMPREERERMLRMAEEDIQVIDEKISWYHKTWPGDKLSDDLKKEVQKYEKLREDAVKAANALRAALKK